MPDYEIPPLRPYELRHLRATLGWSQPRMGAFLGRDAATISRWETGLYAPDPLAAGVLYRLWLDVFGAYDGPYPEPAPPEPVRTDEGLRKLGALLLMAGVGYFIAKGLDELNGEDDE